MIIVGFYKNIYSIEKTKFEKVAFLKGFQMKYLPSALGVFLLLLAQTLFAAQPAFEDAAPFLTNQTFYLATSDISATNFEKVLAEIKVGAKTLFPRLLAEPSVQIYVEKYDQVEKSFAEWQKAALKISDGYVYVTMGQDGMCEIIPVKNADPQTEKDLMKSWEEIKVFSDELLQAVNDGDSDATASKRSIVTRTENAIVCFTPFASLGVSTLNSPNAPETLEEYLKGAAPRPELTTGFEKARFGKISTVFLALPQPLREALNEYLDDFTPPHDFPLTKEEISALANSATCVVVAADSLWELQSAQVLFDSKKGAKKALSLFRKFSSFLSKDVREEFSSPEPALDLINYFLPALTPTQNDSILTLDFSAIREKIAAPVKTILGDLKQFQASQREKFQVDAKAEADRQYEVIKPWISEGTFAVSRLDLERVTLLQWFQSLQGAAEKLMPLTMKMENVQAALNENLEVLNLVDAILSELKAKGAKEAYNVVDSNILIPYKTFVPGVTIKKDVDPEKGAVLLAEDLFGDSELLKDLCPLIDRRLVFGQLKDAVVFFPRINEDTSSDTCWESFIEPLKPAENPSFRDGLELNAQCGLSIVLNVNPLLAEVVKQGIKEMNTTEKVFSVPSTQFIMDGLNVVSLGFDPNLGLYKFNVLSKSPKAAKKVVKLLSLWKEEIFASIGKDPDAAKTPVLRAYVLDILDFIFTFAIPSRDENRLYWDCKQNEQWNYLREHVPAPVLQVGGAGALVGLLLPAIQQARQAAREMQTGTNYKMLAIAMLNHEATYGTYPTAYTVDENGKPLHSWRVAILPFLEEQELYQKIRLDEPWDSEWNSQFHNQCPRVFQSVFNPDPSKAAVGVVVGEKTVFPPVLRKGQRGISLGEIRDGTSNTILLVPCKPVCWMDPKGDPRIGQLQSVLQVEYDGAPGNIPTAFCDGSVQRISLLIEEAIWQRLLLRSDGQAVPMNWD